MSTISLDPYLTFDGTCEEAMNFYKEVFGGELEMTKFGEMPMPGHDNYADKIMHATLKTPDLTFMASDGGESGMPSNVQLSLSGSDGPKLKGFFEALAVEGAVTQPLEKAPWGDEFGMLTDKYGIKWMANIGAEPTA